MSQIRRRQFLIAAGAYLAAPLARAQQAKKVHRVGYLVAGPAPIPPASNLNLAAFVQRMRELGYAEGRNLVVDARYSGAGLTFDDTMARLAEQAAELVRVPVDVIVATNTVATDAARRVTRTVPIVMGSAANPVATGLIASLARPGGNITGSTLDTTDVTAKRIEFLKTMIPQLRRVGVMFPKEAASFPVVVQWLKDNQEAARALGLTLVLVDMPSDAEQWNDVFRKTAADGVGAAVILESRATLQYAATLAQVSVRHRIPLNLFAREQVEAGVLMAYGAELTELYRRAADFVDKILKGANPAELPVEQPTKFTLAVNLKTAKALGLTIPQSLLLRADRVIE